MQDNFACEQTFQKPTTQKHHVVRAMELKLLQGNQTKSRYWISKAACQIR